MIQYKVHLKFKENGKSLNEIITNVLKIELEKHNFMACKDSKIEVPLKFTHHSQSKRSMN